LKVYAVGVGPGSPKYVTEHVKEIIQNCDVVIGYKYTLKTIEGLISGKEIHEITMKTQEGAYQSVKKKLGEKTLVVPFTFDGRIDSGIIEPGQSWAGSFDDAGFYRIIDPDYPWMSIVVYSFPDTGSEVIRRVGANQAGN